VHEQIAIAGSEDEAGSELERILPEPVLAMAGAPGASPRLGVLGAEEVEQVGGFQFRSSVGDSFGIDQQRERDTSLVAEQAGIVQVAQSDRRQSGSGLLEFGFALAQLRDMLTAEDSTVVPQKNNHGWILLPQRAEADIAAARLRQHYIRQLRADGFRHAPIVADHNSRARHQGSV